MKRILIIILLLLVGSTVKPMEPEQQESVSYLKESPTEIKLEIANKFLEQPKLEDIINSLTAFALVDKDFATILFTEPKFQPFFELNRIKNPLEALTFIYNHGYFTAYYDWAEYLHKKFPYLSFFIFMKGLLFLKMHNTPLGQDILKKHHVTTDELTLAVRQNDIEKVFDLLLRGADIHGKDSKGITPLMYALKQKNKDIVQLLTDVGAMQLRKGKGYISKPLLIEEEKGLKGIWK